MKKILVYLLLFTNLFNYVYCEEAIISIFNACRLGSNPKDYVTMATIVKNFDLIGVVEVINRKGVEKLVDELNKQSEDKWSYHISPFAVGSKKHKEYFAYIYKKNKVKFLKSEGFYKNMRSSFLREPYAATFKIGEFDFTLILVHTIYGKNIWQRKAENANMGEVYDYFQDLNENEQDVILAGDFNLYALDSSFKKLREHKDRLTHTLDTKYKTTVGYKGLANSYDNFFISNLHTTEYTGKCGTINFASNDHINYRKNISDHLPVYIVVDTLVDDD